MYLQHQYGGIWSLDPQLFFDWSRLALPLWIIGQAGIPSRSSPPVRIGPVRVSTSTLLLVCWVAMLIVPLCAYATWHAWRGTSAPRSPAELRVT
jgi:hypothetical protein